MKTKWLTKLGDKKAYSCFVSTHCIPDMFMVYDSVCKGRQVQVTDKTLNTRQSNDKNYKKLRQIQDI